MSETTTSTTQRTYTRWTPEQVQTLRDNASLGAEKIAELLGRSDTQIKTKAAQLGISLRKPGSKGGRRQAPRP